MNKQSKEKLLLAVSLLLCTPTVYADAAVPLLYLAVPAFAFSIIPIIVIEAIYLQNKLSIGAKQAFKLSTIANIASTIVGIPIAWFVLVELQMVMEKGSASAYGSHPFLRKIFAALWLGPDGNDPNWMTVLAGVFLLIPFFSVSWWSEYLVCKRLLKNNCPDKLNLYVRNANLITYGLMILMILCQFYRFLGPNGR